MKTTTNQKQRIQLLEDQYVEMCKSEGLTLQDLYDRIKHDMVTPTLVRIIERKGKENATRAYADILKVAHDPFALIGAGLVLWKFGANGDTVFEAVQVVVQANCVAECIASLAQELGMLN